MNARSTIHVTIPSDPAAFGVVRAVAARSAAMANLTLEAIDDVCLAVDEAALQLIGAGADRVRISMEASEDGFTAELAAAGKLDSAGASPDAAIGRHILAALVDDLDFGETTVRFTKLSAT